MRKYFSIIEAICLSAMYPRFTKKLEAAGNIKIYGFSISMGHNFPDEGVVSIPFDSCGRFCGMRSLSCMRNIQIRKEVGIL